MPPKKEGGASKKKTVNMEKNGQNPGQKLTDPGQKKTPLANNTSQTKSPIAPLILEGAKLTKMQVTDLVKKHLKDIRVNDIQLSRTGMFTIYASDVSSFNRLLNEFTAILATNGQTSAKLYVPRSIQRIKDTDKITFVKKVDLEIPEDRITVALKDVGLDVTDVIQLKNKERNTPTQTVKVTFTDAQNRNTFVQTGLQVDLMYFVAEAAKHNSKPVQCYMCLKYNHVANYCKTKQQICARCGDNHQVDKCSGAADIWKCCNSKGSHLATSNECPIYKEQEKRMLRAIQQYSTFSSQPTATPYNINSLVDFPMLSSNSQQGLNTSSNDLIDTLVNILSMKMEKIIEATTNRLLKSLHQRISKIEKTLAVVDSMMDVASTETSDDSMADSDNEIHVINVQQNIQQHATQKTATSATSNSTPQQHTTANDIKKTTKQEESNIGNS
ncbi:unnamed protein product [Rotaria magnacalcarata]|uniref:Gag-like protein n=2 Tax=Rotaria magnacalcarata TaxID=392030 RepID=A0A814QCC5_9BILA|nr:unnamed protein product [Rotaria magnacalcarata]CAF2132333.1 unnamed protein product [Rotaria magnacalcarata]CAF3975419.1 unnamed protein product [Rotaria magnacalcarata]CAF4162726.1 unnamed protein product [Rotaria magnacalcarata]